MLLSYVTTLKHNTPCPAPPRHHPRTSEKPRSPTVCSCKYKQRPPTRSPSVSLSASVKIGVQTPKSNQMGCPIDRSCGHARSVTSRGGHKHFVGSMSLDENRQKGCAGLSARACVSCVGWSCVRADRFMWSARVRKRPTSTDSFVRSLARSLAPTNICDDDARLPD